MPTGRTPHFQAHPAHLLVHSRIPPYAALKLVLPFKGHCTRTSHIPSPIRSHPESHERVREQEGLAMNLARAMGIPAPRFISFGAAPDKWHFPSLLMTRLSGTPMDYMDDDEIEFDIVKEDLKVILARMRNFANPWGNGNAVCGVDGGAIYGPLIPGQPFPRSSNEIEFRQRLQEFCKYDDVTLHRHVEGAKAFHGLPAHPIVFTHGDLDRHNIMVGPDGHICGIFDWEAAAWLPDFWEISVVSLLQGRKWGQFVHLQVTEGRYAREVEAHRHLWPFLSDSFSY